MRFWLTAVILCALCCAPRLAPAATVLTAGHYTVDPSQVTLLIELRGSSELNTLVAMTLRMQIGEFEAPAPPKFVPDFDLSDIWPDTTLMIPSTFDPPHTAFTSISTEGDPLPAFTNRLLATIAIDVSTAAPGTYPIHWLVMESNLTEFYEQNSMLPLNEEQLQLIPGSITVVPEPASLLLTVVGISLLAAGYRYVR